MRGIIQIFGIFVIAIQCLAGSDRAGLNWWSLREIARPLVPETGKVAKGSPIDAFIRSTLKEHGLNPAPPAGSAHLIRRLYFDLTGIPPAYKEVQEFVNSSNGNAYPELVERLLSSPRFGERWARHWLDVVRYAETNGYERDAVKPHIWKYRDWVVHAFNSDMPYHRFVTEQLAGDEIEGRNESSVIATGMLRAGTWNDEPNDAQEYKYERLEDMVDVVTTAFLGMTVRCARCHDHKFDPIPQRDYYRIAAAFWSGPIEPGSARQMGGPDAGQLGYKEVFGWTDIHREPPPIHLLINGDPNKKSDIVPPGHLSLVPHLDLPLVAPPDESKTSRRRLQLAGFITSPRNPLTPRVMVNRIWQHLMGRGIVATPNNFGYKSASPSHPELLDWMAHEFVRDGWSIKSVIRKIVLSETYRQSSLHPDADKYQKADPENHLLWRHNRRRMDAEALRDALLYASGELDFKMGGESFYPELAPEVLEGFSRKSSAWSPSPPGDQLRRSIYMISKRHLLVPLMKAFDFPSSEKPCGKRDSTTVVSQSLAMLNNRFVHSRSRRLAEVALKVSRSTEDAIAFAWKKILMRDPDAGEMDLALAHYHQQVAHFEGRAKPGEVLPAKQVAVSAVPGEGLCLWLSADAGVSLDASGKLLRWKDQSKNALVVTQDLPRSRPVFLDRAIAGKPAIRFSGEKDFLGINGQVLKDQDFTILAVASDRSSSRGHREIISNWSGSDGNAGTSVFLGLTGKARVRFSDNFSSASNALILPNKPFLLSASTGTSGSDIFYNGQVLAARGSPLTARNMVTPWVIGQQGNINGEYWQGDIAELLVYSRQLKQQELEALGKHLAGKYNIPLAGFHRAVPVQNPALLGLASVCHVLLNSNEFLYID